MIKVLFVDLANVIRSQMAEGIMQNLIKKKNLGTKISVESAGITDTSTGEYTDPRVVKILKKEGIDFRGRASKISSHHLVEFDYILAMDNLILKDVNRMISMTQKLNPLLQVRLVRDWEKTTDGAEIMDPFYGEEEDFWNTYQDLKNSLEYFLKYLIQTYDL